MSRQWILVGSAPDTDISVVAPLVEKGVPVICADGGMQTVSRTGIKPHFFIGDLDSGTKPDGVDGMILPEEKDYTDIHTALLWVLDRGAKDIYILGCTNGRADHYFANILLLEMLHEKNARGMIMDVQNRILFHGTGTMKLRKGREEFCLCEDAVCVPEDFKYVSILPLDEKLTGVTLRGMKYPLECAELSRNCPIGVSNEMVSDEAGITVECGRAIVIFSKDVK